MARFTGIQPGFVPVGAPPRQPERATDLRGAGAPSVGPRPDRAGGAAGRGRGEVPGPLVTVVGSSRWAEGYAFLLASDCGVAPTVYPAPVGSWRDVASAYFRPMAEAIDAGRPMVCRNSWLDHDADAIVGVGRRRMLERTALSMGWTVASGSGKSNYPRNEGPGAGCWDPGRVALVLCDRPNSAPAGSLKCRLPFISMLDGGASAWLAEALEAAGVPERRLYWVNAYDSRGEPTPWEFLDRLDPTAIVAVGGAGAWADEFAPNRVVTVTGSPAEWMRSGRPAADYHLVKALARARGSKP